jgi:Tol biopolymer transport system component
VEATLASMVWLDRSGKHVATPGPPARYSNVALSPDGRLAAVTQADEPLPPDLWLFDTGVGRGIRLTRDSFAQLAAVFSADGRHIFYSAYSAGPFDLFQMPLQGVREPAPLLRTKTTKTPNDASPDGRYLLYREFNPGTRGDLKIVSLDGDPTPRVFIATADDETNGDFSPDGRWVAYASDESGHKEVYVASFPDPARRFRVSADGGSQPRWSRDGKELFYVRSGQLLACAVDRKGDELTFGESRPLFPLPLFWSIDTASDIITRYDVAPDGRFFALLRAGDEEPKPLTLVLNWAETLKKP